MVQVSEGSNASPITTENTPNTTTPKPGNDWRSPAVDDETSYPTETVAAATIAVLAVVIVITMLLVFRALRKRQRARQGEQFGETAVPTITTGVMGSGASAYAVQNVPVRGAIRWESINPSTETTDNTVEAPNR